MGSTHISELSHLRVIDDHASAVPLPSARREAQQLEPSPPTRRRPRTRAKMLPWRRASSTRRLPVSCRFRITKRHFAQKSHAAAATARTQRPARAAASEAEASPRVHLFERRRARFRAQRREHVLVPPPADRLRRGRVPPSPRSPRRAGAARCRRARFRPRGAPRARPGRAPGRRVPAGVLQPTPKPPPPSPSSPYPPPPSSSSCRRIAESSQQGMSYPVPCSQIQRR